MQTFSQRSKNDLTKNDVWDVSSLIKISEGLPSKRWKIPRSFLDGWSWGEDHISDHLVGCLDADLSRPILIWNGKVVDGCHRICKALSQGETHLQAIDLSCVMPPPNREEDYLMYSREVKWCFKDMVSVLKVLKNREYDFRHPLDI